MIKSDTLNTTTCRVEGSIPMGADAVILSIEYHLTPHGEAKIDVATNRSGWNLVAFCNNNEIWGDLEQEIEEAIKDSYDEVEK